MKEPTTSGLVREILLEKSDRFFGFCIKGGKHRPLGIFVLSVDPGSPASKRVICFHETNYFQRLKFHFIDFAGQANLQTGDCILAANGIDFNALTLDQAIDFLYNTKRVVLKVKRPAQKYQDKCVDFDRNKIVDSNPNPGQPIRLETRQAPDSEVKEVILVRKNLDKSFGFKINKIAKKNNVFIISK